MGYSLITSATGCAGMTPPTGGPRDSLPPMIVNVTPRDSTVNFTGKKVVIQFNEYVQVDDVQKNMIVSPTPKINPTVEAKLRTVTVTLRDTLEEQTTYSLDFGKAIRDINEGNILRDYRYIFTTGNALDSLQVGGRVLVAETGRADSTLIVMLHSNFDDSAVVKERPRYIARVDSAGYFLFQNLPPDTFAVYALKDEAGARRYLAKDQLFGFADSTVHSTAEKKDILLYAFQAEDTTKKTAVTDPPEEDDEKKPKFLRVQTNAAETLDLLSNLELNFSTPLRHFDSTKLVFSDETFKPLTNYYFRRDTSNKKITLLHPWTENTAYNLVMDTTFAEDTLGRRIASTDTISFRTKRKAEYGLVRLRFLNLPMNENPVLQFVQGDQVKFSHVFTNNQFYAELFAPGEYDLRLVYDTNRNGKWDTGQFFGKHVQPERVRLISRKLNVKPNWDTEVDIEL